MFIENTEERNQFFVLFFVHLYFLLVVLLLLFSFDYCFIMTPFIARNKRDYFVKHKIINIGFASIY